MNNSEISEKIRQHIKSLGYRLGYRYSSDVIKCDRSGTTWVFSDVNSNDMMIVRRSNDDHWDVIAHDADLKTIVTDFVVQLMDE